MIEFRDVLDEDRNLLREWRNRPHVARHMYSDATIGEGEHARWFASAMTDQTRRYWIVRADGQDVGLVNLYDIDHHHSAAMLASYIAVSESRGRGIGSAMELHTLRYAFDELRLNRLGGEVLATNAAALRMHERFGFVQEGRVRQRIRKDDAFVDVVIIGMLRSEWVAKRSQIELQVKPRAR